MAELFFPPVGTFNSWLKKQIYTTPEKAFGVTEGGVVPNVDDEVITWIGNGKFIERVIGVNSDNTSVLEPVVPVDSLGNRITTGTDLGTAELLTLANLYLNHKNNKFPVAVDVRIPITGVDLQYAKLFIGTDISNTGRVISVKYDESGNAISDRLDVLRVDPDDPDNIQYVIRDGNVNQLLAENTVVTLVIYNSSNGPVRIRSLTVKYNSLVANLDNSAMYVKDLELTHTWVDPQNPNRILLPKNLLNQSFSPTVRKVYQSGSKELIPGNDSDLSIIGWGDFLLGTVGDRCEIVVKYVLKDGERSIVVDPVLGKHIAKTYEVLIVDKGVGTNYKLFPLLDYVPGGGYSLRWILQSSDYVLKLDVTNDVAFNALNGESYGGKQTINYALDLNNVEEVASNEEVAGTVTVQLLAPPITQSTAYRLYDVPDDAHPYGDDLILKLRPGMADYGLDITCGYTVKSQWLDSMFYRLNPMYDALLVPEAPEPTHVDVRIGNTLITYAIEDWDTEKVWPTDLPVNGSGADITFYILNSNNERLYLATTRLYTEIV